MRIKLLLFFLAFISVCCHDDICESGHFMFSNGTCLETCPTGYLISNHTDYLYCSPPCIDAYVSPDDRCFADCGRKFVVRQVFDIAYCDLDPSLETSMESGRCPNGMFRYEDDHTCQSACTFPYAPVWDFQNTILYCRFNYQTGCREDEILEADGCVPNVTFPFPNPDSHLRTASARLNISLEYVVGSFRFLRELGPAKLVQKIASILSIPTSMIDIDAFEMNSAFYTSTIASAEVIIKCLPEEESMDAALQAVDSMGQTLYSEMLNGALDVLEDVVVHPRTYTIQLMDRLLRTPYFPTPVPPGDGAHNPKPRPESPEDPPQTQFLAQPHNNEDNLGMELAIGIGVLAVILIGVFAYKIRQNKAKKMAQVAADFVKKKAVKDIEAGPERIEEEASPSDQVPSALPPIFEGVITMIK